MEDGGLESAVAVDPSWRALCSNPNNDSYPLPRDIKNSNCLSELLHLAIPPDAC